MDHSEYDLYPARPESRLPNVYGTYPGKAVQSQRLKASSVSRAEANGEFPLLIPPSQQGTLEASEMDWPSPGLPPTPVRNGKLLHKKPKDDFYSTGTPSRFERQAGFRTTNGRYGNERQKSDYSQVNLEANRSIDKTIDQSTSADKIEQEYGFIFEEPIIWNLRHLVLNQFLGITLVVVSHLNYCRRVSSVFVVALALNIFLFSVHGTTRMILWNSPIEILGYLAQKSLFSLIYPLSSGHNQYAYLSYKQNQSILWLGPVLGALVGCILYRLTTSKQEIYKAGKPKICRAKK
uniref:Uncharacterized protein n=1 Tax=Ditylenchus dipsaci TaxID=166011 RepID=A0A915DZD1_9BILA